MKKCIEHIVKDNVVTAIICDVCKKEFNMETDLTEIQEFHNIYFTGGYGSVFGDGCEFELDICQHCLKQILGKYFRQINVIE